ncbi:MAG: hypothetical protein HC844_11150 [Tabrizicola sp.]|nr:hypothetical protein [Tabrizicola sp.]
MRNILNDLGLHQSNAAELRAAMKALDPATRRELSSLSQELETSSGRSNDAYLAVGDFAQQEWLRLMKPLHDKAEAAMKDMPAALAAIKTGHAEQFERHRQSYAEQGEVFKDALTDARNQLRKGIRQVVKETGLGLDTAARAPLVDHLTRSAPVPAKITEVMTASGKLEAAKAQHDLDLEQRRHMGMTPAANPRPRADYTM